MMMRVIFYSPIAPSRGNAAGRSSTEKAVLIFKQQVIFFPLAQMEIWWKKSSF